LAREAHAGDRDELLADIGLGQAAWRPWWRQPDRAVWQPARHPPAEGEPARPAAITSATPVVVRGTEGMALQIANCCNPIPGDAIVGHMRRDLGLVVHQLECRHAQRARRADPERWIDLQWAEDLAGMYDVNLEVRVVNERGVLGRAAAAIAEAESKHPERAHRGRRRQRDRDPFQDPGPGPAPPGACSPLDPSYQAGATGIAPEVRTGSVVRGLVARFDRGRWCAGCLTDS